MKKKILLLMSVLILVFSGCGISDTDVAHKEGNLIITNYSRYEVTDITIAHAGETNSASSKPIKDTQFCYFSIEPANDYVYTVSFIDNDGNEHSKEFTDDFTEESKVFIAIQYNDNAWSIDYDEIK